MTSKCILKILIFKFTFSVLFLLFFNLSAFAITEESEETSWARAYNNLTNVKVEFINKEDPDEYYDYKDFYISPYPLVRTSCDMYFKNMKIPPDYYLLTPRQYSGQYVVLFKQKGKILFQIPVFYHEEVVPEVAYPSPPSPKTSWWKKPFVLIKKIFRIKDRYEYPVNFPKSKMNAFDLDRQFYEIDLYYENAVYKMIFKKNPY
jgi:hypothetical protein